MIRLSYIVTTLCVGIENFVSVWKPTQLLLTGDQFRNLLVMQTVDPTTSDRSLR